ncbi:MAG: 4Fe-4S single cluster domain-containing protein [Rubripirellula sp.]
MIATRAEGPGLRLAIWLQGCPLRCPGCCNPEMLPMAGGTPRHVDELTVELEIAAKRGIEGITLLGGEPFAQAAAAAQLAARAQQRGFSVMAFSGFTLAQLQNRRDPDVTRLLEQTDLLVDGPFLNQHPDRNRRWIGSTNQQIHFLTDRYKAQDPCWKEPNTVELRWMNGELQVNGFPAG